MIDHNERDVNDVFVYACFLFSFLLPIHVLVMRHKSRTRKKERVFLSSCVLRIDIHFCM